MSRTAHRALAILALLALPGPACSDPGGDAAAPETGAATATRASEPREALHLELELIGADGAPGARSFAPRAPIRMRLTLRNPSTNPVTLSFSSGRTHDVVVLDPSDREVWRWSHARRFTQALSEIELTAGGESRFEIVCDPTEAGSAPLPPGRYRAAGLIPAHGHELRSAPVSFAIE